MGAYAGLLWRQRLLLLVALLLIAAVTGAGWQVAPRLYTASSVVVWTPDPSSNYDSADITEFGGNLVHAAGSKQLLSQVAAGLSTHRSVSDLRGELDVRWEPSASEVSIEVQDSNSDTAVAIATEVAALLPSYGELYLDAGAFSGSPSMLVSTVVNPVTWVVAILVIMLGWLLTLYLAARRDRQTNLVTGAAEVERALAAPVLAHVRMPRDHTSLPALTPGAAAADPFRHVRVALGVTGRRAQHRISGSLDLDTAQSARLVVVSAPVRGQSAVWVATNLALSLAQDTWRVLLVDGRLGSRFPAPLPGEPSGPGLLDVLRGTDLHDALTPGPVDGLSVLTAGTRVDAEGLLTESAFTAVVRQAQRHFDVVVVVTPALSVCDDALVMATPGSLLLTVPEGRVTLDALRNLGSRMRPSVPRLLGSVLVGRLSERAYV